MTETRKFALDDILTVTTGRLLSRRHMDGLYDILGFMTGESLFTHQLGRAADACGPALLEQHPKLRGVQPPDGTDALDLMAWLVSVERQYGETLPVAPLAVGVWEQRNPVEELCDMVGPEKVYVVPAPGEESE